MTTENLCSVPLKEKTPGGIAVQQLIEKSALHRQARSLNSAGRSNSILPPFTVGFVEAARPGVPQFANWLAFSGKELSFPRELIPMFDASNSNESEQNWPRMYALTGWQPEFSRVSNERSFCKPPPWIRDERTASFCIFERGPARDFGTGISYSAFQLYLCYLGLDPHTHNRDPRRIQAAREFWPEKYASSCFGGLDSKSRRKLILNARLCNSSRAFQPCARTNPSLPLKELLLRTRAWDLIGPVLKSEHCDLLFKFAEVRSFDCEALFKRDQNDVFPIESFEMLCNHLSASLGKDLAIQTLINGGLLRQETGQLKRRVNSPSICFLTRCFVEGQPLLVADVRLRPFETNTIKEFGMPNLADDTHSLQVPPGLFGLDHKKAGERHRGSVVFLAESACDAFALQELFQRDFENRNGLTAVQAVQGPNVSFLGLSGASIFKEEHLMIMREAALLVVALDDDTAGNNCAEKILKFARAFEMNANKVKEYRLEKETFKDPNDLLREQKKNLATGREVQEIFNILYQG